MSASLIADRDCEHGYTGEERRGCACGVCLAIYGKPWERIASVAHLNVNALLEEDADNA